ncbi:hypothetical protein M0R19_08925 [Candidatus Pacearchaeota archaeon]|jgi:uncharacterized protein YihD (DUF1040 family)|nr:hypothetical protein [bacterium]MCK9597282.1 hypothetical protein [Candidatus Pacearchaeota archaeon]
MRDPKRINRILKELKNIWKELPDLRLGQLIQNLGDVYYIEDDDLIKRLRKLYHFDEDK